MTKKEAKELQTHKEALLIANKGVGTISGTLSMMLTALNNPDEDVTHHEMYATTRALLLLTIKIAEDVRELGVKFG